MLVEKRIDEQQWSDYAAEGKGIDPESFLLSDAPDGEAQQARRGLAPAGKEVVFFPEGYKEQNNSIGMPTTPLRWTSWRHRRSVECGMAGSLASSGRRVESTSECLVSDCSYFVRVRGQRENQEVAAPPVAAPPAGEIENEAEALISLADLVQPSEAEEPEEEIEHKEKELFLRLRLERQTKEGSKVACYIDYYASAECGEFIIDKKRYQRACRKNFKLGDRVSMFWRDSDNPVQGQWFKGVVRSACRRMSSYSEHLERHSKWESLEILWNETGEVSRVNSWEIERTQPSDVPSTSRAAGNPSGAHEPYEPERFDPADYHDDDYVPSSAKRLKVSDPYVPQTISAGHYNKQNKMDWSDKLCHVCSLPGELLQCKGQCLHSFHKECIPEEDAPTSSGQLFYCRDCREGLAKCAFCNKSGRAGVDLHKCKMGGCGSFYHLECLKKLPSWSVAWGPKNQRGADVADLYINLFKAGQQKVVFVCPGHFCHECHLSGDALRMVRCSNCNVHAYHASHTRWDHCLRVASDKNVICPHCTYNAFHKEGVSAMPEIVSYTPTFESEKIGRVRSQTGSAEVILVGKKRFLFGTHSKGGGCDFYVNTKGVKFHSEIVAESDGKYFIKQCHHGSKVMKVPLLVNDDFLTNGAKVYLKDGDVFEIGQRKFIFGFLPADSSARAAQESLRFPSEICLTRPKAKPTHDGPNSELDGLLESFDISGYNVAYQNKMKGRSNRQKAQVKVRVQPVHFMPTKKSTRERKRVKYDDMVYTDSEPEEYSEYDDDDEDDHMAPEVILTEKVAYDFSENLLPPPLPTENVQDPGTAGPSEIGNLAAGGDLLNDLDGLQHSAIETAEISTQTDPISIVSQPVAKQSLLEVKTEQESPASAAKQLLDAAGLLDSQPPGRTEKEERYAQLVEYFKTVAEFASEKQAFTEKLLRLMASVENVLGV